MKTRALFTILPLLFLAPLTMAQQPPRVPGAQNGGGGGGFAGGNPALSPAEQAAEKPFTLDFEGGQVVDFVTAVETATKEPFNVIIPASARDLHIPPVRVREVTLSRLLSALSTSSMERKAIVTAQNFSPRPAGGGSNIEYFDTGYRFTPTSGNGGSMVWQLTVTKPVELPPPPPVQPVPPIARFYQLKPNLESGLKVEDITTVAQTAWKMMKLDAKDIPEMKVHEETGILIVVGSEYALQVLDSVLRELPKAGGKPAPAPGLPVPRNIPPQPIPPQ